MAVLQTDIYLRVSTPCSICSKFCVMTEASGYCQQCKLNLCMRCLDDHSKFPALSKHQIVDKSKAGYRQFMKNSKKCGSHFGQYINSYCEIHDEVCCSICITIKHRYCSKTERILKMSKEKRHKQFKRTKQALETFLKYANQDHLEKIQHLKEIQDKNDQIIEDIDKFEQEITEKVREIAETSRQNIRDATGTDLNAAKSEVAELKAIIAKLHNSFNELIKTDKNEVETFVNTKNSQKCLAEAKVMVKSLKYKWLKRELSYKLNDQITDTKLQLLGMLM